MIIYLLILFGKILEVSLMTVRVVLISKGERRIGSIVAFFEICLWILIVSNVIDGLKEDPLKAVAYALGFAIGNFTGSLIEDKIGIGTSQIQIIVKREHGEGLTKHLYESGLPCTVVEAQGRQFERQILYVIVPRRTVRTVIRMAKQFQESAVITVHEIKPWHGGWGIKK
jgi:uncharacterized protein YebE (UPF0316 family)